MNNNNNKKSQFYTIVDFPEDNKTLGNFEGKSPKIAGNKAFSFLLKFIDLNEQNEKNEDNFLGKFLVFVIKNVNTNEEYKYIGNRIKLKNPVNISVNGKNVKYYYKNVIGKYKPELDLI